MNILSIETLDGSELILKIPTGLHEITFGKLIELQNPELTDFEFLSILTGTAIDDLYNVKSYQETTKTARLYIDLFNMAVTRAELKIPKKLRVSYADKVKTVKLKKYLAIEPAGAYYNANKAISTEIYMHIDLHGEDNWQNHFKPKLETCANVVNDFLNYRVTGHLWTDEKRDDFAKDMIAADVLAIAKHFFNVFPNLNSYKPKSKLSLFPKTILKRFRALFSFRIKVYRRDNLKQTA